MDGVPESETLISETTTVIAIDQIIAVGPEEMDSPDNTSHGQANAGSNTQTQPETDEPSTQQPSDTTGDSGGSSSGNDAGTGSGSGGSSQTPPAGSTSGGSGSDTGNTGGNSGGSSQGRLWHPTVAQAQTYAAGAAAQYGWTRRRVGRAGLAVEPRIQLAVVRG